MQSTTAANARILLGLGASQAGNWGAPPATLSRCIAELPRAGFRVLSASGLYETQAVGPGGDGVYVNAAVMGESHLAPAALLRALKRLERRAGRRSAMRWGPRPLDIDILGWRGRVARGAALTLPHPRMHLRPFVLAPLAEIAPGWRHPELGLSARQLLRRLPARTDGRVLRRLDGEAGRLPCGAEPPT